MDRAEIDRRIVGLLTLAYREEWDPDAGADLQALGAAVASLTEQIGMYEINREAVPPGQYDLIQELLGSGVMQRSSDIPLLIAGFVGIFVSLCHEIEDAHLELDIESFLQRKGLEAADER